MAIYGHPQGRRAIPSGERGFSIPLVVALTLILSIGVYALQLYTSQSVRNVHRSVWSRRAEYYAEAGANRAAALLRSRSFSARTNRGARQFSFGYIATYTEQYAEGKFTVTLVDIPAIIQNFKVDFRLAEYEGVFIWSEGSSRGVSRYLLARYVPDSGPLPVFRFKGVPDAAGAVEYNDFEVN